MALPETSSKEGQNSKSGPQDDKDFDPLDDQYVEAREKFGRTSRSGLLSHIEQDFYELFDRYLALKGGETIEWDKIRRPTTEDIIPYKSLPEPTNLDGLLSKLVIVKLNGGLGTSMGCVGPKSIIPVRDDLTFLDLTVRQVERLNQTYKCRVPLVLMNSFNTHDDTLKIIKKYKNRGLDIYTFLQSKFPRINRETLEPEPNEYYPPGHGDFYKSFEKSGLLEKFIHEGREYCFISNIDNLGAGVDFKILNQILTSRDDSPHFVMEVTDKTMADVKGGTLCEYENKLTLLEIAQVPVNHIDDFKSVKKFKIFNTNNLWVNLKSIRNLLLQNKLKLDIIVNRKHLPTGVEVIQLETAAGSAMRYFDRAIGINVPRSRFLPVKKTSDLLLIKSNLYDLSDGCLRINQERAFPTVPLVKLGDSHFSKMRDFNKRFGSIPDLLELNHLTVSGDVTLGKDISLRGTVIIIANHGQRIDIPSGACLENKIVTGNLHILDH